MKAPANASSASTCKTKIRSTATQSMPRVSGFWLRGDDINASFTGFGRLVADCGYFGCERLHTRGKVKLIASHLPLALARLVCCHLRSPRPCLIAAGGPALQTSGDELRGLVVPAASKTCNDQRIFP